MSRLKLTVKQVLEFNQPGKSLGDGAGLSLRIDKRGYKSWIFRYMLKGRSRAMGLGSASKYTLAEARKKAMECRRLLLDKIDPIDTIGWKATRRRKKKGVR